MNLDYQRYLASREWAQRREAVRERSGGRCERCLTNTMQAVHHLTYANLGNEPLTDLVAICNPCHEYLSAKRQDDPITAGVKVYLAGKITRNPWRNELMVTDHKGRLNGPDFCSPANFILEDRACEDWPTAERALAGGFDFVGPWFVDTRGGHQSVTDETHGTPPAGDHGALDRQGIIIRCREAIDRADIVFAWIDTPGVHGTLWELGYASAQSKITAIALPQFGGWARDFWFPIFAADCLIAADSAKEAWQTFCTRWSESLNQLLKERK